MCGGTAKRGDTLCGFKRDDVPIDLQLSTQIRRRKVSYSCQSTAREAHL